MAGIKFHGAIDVVISGNHIYRCGSSAGIWLDWMAQGAQVTGNLLHDNDTWGGDLFCEVDHGPLLVANNIFLSPKSHLTMSQGGAYVHNLIAREPASGGFRRPHDAVPQGAFHRSRRAAQQPLAATCVSTTTSSVAPGDISPYDNATLPVLDGRQRLFERRKTLQARSRSAAQAGLRSRHQARSRNRTAGTSKSHSTRRGARNRSANS